ncbi:chemotaxis protein CheB [Chitinophaga sp. Mgbs1]|uniref:protein-glutamate methylesterase n=1 Tax=Chitinophaga solisilvae TaxID=1233460 RepID=A0A3S1CYL5_9BACT|nr:chemotaxis protein CheB [Chitinophaga solisilvae]
MVAIGGSAGSLPVLVQLLNSLHQPLKWPVVIILHRLKNVQSELHNLLSVKIPITEPVDKEPVESRVYLAPQNYHLLIEEDRTFSLDYSEPLHFSRPSIDVSFFSAAAIYRRHALGILLSGANKDGAAGIQRIISHGGTGIVQQPDTALFSNMPQAALDLSPQVQAMTIDGITGYLNQLR